MSDLPGYDSWKCEEPQYEQDNRRGMREAPECEECSSDRASLKVQGSVRQWLCEECAPYAVGCADCHKYPLGEGEGPLCIPCADKRDRYASFVKDAPICWAGEDEAAQ